MRKRKVGAVVYESDFSQEDACARKAWTGRDRGLGGDRVAMGSRLKLLAGCPSRTELLLLKESRAIRRRLAE